MKCDRTQAGDWMELKKIIMPSGRILSFWREDGQTWLEVIRDVVLPMSAD